MQKMSTTFAQFTTDPKRRKLLEREGLTFEATELISKLMQEHGVSKAKLADRLGVSRSFITQILSGARNLTLHTFADVVFALGHRVELDTLPLADVKDDQGYVTTYEFPNPRIAGQGAKKWEKARLASRIIIRPELKHGDDDRVA